MTSLGIQIVAMLLALLICQTVLVAANPFHRYPFVFLLDIGNEELEKTNTEQIRLSIPGGSVALRYPAIGDGDTIGHVRVSSVDFGTDLKANIVDGGPGYKYVVIVLMGNAGVPYDAVLTVQTVKDKVLNPQNAVSTDSYDDILTEADVNNSAEDLSDIDDDSQSQNSIESNAELMQSSSNVYKYAQNDVNEDIGGDDDPRDEVANEEQYSADSQGYNSYEVSEDESDQKDIHVQYKEDLNDDQDIQVKDIDSNDEADDVSSNLEASNDEESLDSNNFDNEEINAKAERYSSDYSADNEPVSVVDSNLYSKYEALKPHLFGGAVYSQDDEQGRQGFPQDALDYEDPGELEQAFNDVDVHDDAEKYKDSNNNDYVDSDDGSAVAY